MKAPTKQLYCKQIKCYIKFTRGKILAMYLQNVGIDLTTYRMRTLSNAKTPVKFACLVDTFVQIDVQLKYMICEYVTKCIRI